MYRSYTVAVRPGIARQGEFLPDTLRAPNATTVVVCVHSSECKECREYVTALQASESEFVAWDARLVVVVPDQVNGEFSPAFSRTVAAPADSPCANSAAVFVADRYGQIFHAAESGAEHALPGPREIDEWLKYLGTLCPECDVPDEPGRGGWAGDSETP